MTRRDRSVLLVLATAALITAYWFLIMAPTRSQAGDLDKKIAGQQQRLTEAQGKQATAEQAKQSYRTDYAVVAKLGQAVPADDEVASMLFQLDKAAGKAKIDFRSLKLAETGSGSSSSGAGSQLPPGAAVGDAGFPAMPFSFKFDGTFFDMQRFLKRVAGFTRTRKNAVDVKGRLVTIDSISVGASRKGFPKVSVDISATAYVVPREEGLTGGATVAGPAADPAAGATPAAGDPSAAGDAPAAPAAAALTTGGTR